jgi:lipid-binding SYLF domain-containing protein
MKNKWVFRAAKTAMIGCLTLGMTTFAYPAAEDTKDEVEQSQKAGKVFSEVMDAPDKGIPKNLVDSARCVLVFPNVLKAGFIVGGRGGRGVASCRTGAGWSAPAYFNLGGGSVGLQIGAESTDFVLLVMNEKGMNSLLSDQFTLGGDASVAAGPVGREAGAETDAKLNAQILSYSRSKGLFGGLELKGVVIKPDKDDMRDVYGANVTAKEVLNGNKVTTPAGVSAFPTTLTRYSTGAAKK